MVTFALTWVLLIGKMSAAYAAWRSGTEELARYGKVLTTPRQMITRGSCLLCAPDICNNNVRQCVVVCKHLTGTPFADSGAGAISAISFHARIHIFCVCASACRLSCRTRRRCRSCCATRARAAVLAAAKHARSRRCSCRLSCRLRKCCWWSKWRRRVLLRRQPAAGGLVLAPITNSGGSSFKEFAMRWRMLRSAAHSCRRKTDHCHALHAPSKGHLSKPDR